MQYPFAQQKPQLEAEVQSGEVLTVPVSSRRIVVTTPEGLPSGSDHASKIRALTGPNGSHAWFRQEESPCSTLSK
jgi:hypothetical protein